MERAELDRLRPPPAARPPSPPPPSLHPLLSLQGSVGNRALARTLAPTGSGSPDSDRRGLPQPGPGRDSGLLSAAAPASRDLPSSRELSDSSERPVSTQLLLAEPSTGREGTRTARAAGPGTVQRQAVQPKAPVVLTGQAGRFQKFIDAGGPYTFSMYALNDDIIGHAWIGVRRGDGKYLTAGFWPASLWSGIVGPGQLMVPDGHEGQQTSGFDLAIPDITQMYRLLSVIQDWDGALYSLLFHNCAHFVVDAWMRVTGQNVFPGKNEDLMVDMWNPLMIGMAIDERNRKKAEVDRARTGQTDDSGGDNRMAGDPTSTGDTGSAGAPADSPAVDGDLVPA